MTKPLAHLAPMVAGSWSVMTRAASWLSARRLPIAVLAGVAIALWIMHGQAQNGRYAFVPGEHDAVVDTRDGTIYTILSSRGVWSEVRPRAGRSELHRPAPLNTLENFLQSRRLDNGVDQVHEDLETLHDDLQQISSDLEDLKP